MCRVAEGGDPRAEQDRMNVQADLIHQAGGQERLCQFATAHQADVFPRCSLEFSDEFDCVTRHELDTGLVNALERAGEHVGSYRRLLAFTTHDLRWFLSG